ncbi:MAG: hypothetical protein MZV65_28970, partial [Chromatiales bacterium]|nr:hypothetical protein [Chromatiales bacterium]
MMDDAGNTTVLNINKAVVDQEPPSRCPDLEHQGRRRHDAGSERSAAHGRHVRHHGPDLRTAKDDEENLPTSSIRRTAGLRDDDRDDAVPGVLRPERRRSRRRRRRAARPRHDLADPPDLGDMSAQTASVYWNTTGLPEGQYLLKVIAVDEVLSIPFVVVCFDLSNTHRTKYT